MSPTPRADVTTEALDRVEAKPPEVTQRGMDRLEQHIKELLNERDRRYEERAQLTERALSAALNAAEKAVSKAEMASEKRFEGVNEFRGQLSDQQRTFIPRSEAEQRMASTEKKVEALEKSLLNVTAASRGGRDVWGYVVGGIGVLLAIASFALRAKP